MTRVLALDYGSARCGCAVSDPTATIVYPIETVKRPNSRQGMTSLTTLVSELGVDLVVVGLPISLRGHSTAQTLEARSFAERLTSLLGPEVAVEMHDERLTTRLAARDVGASASEDSRAAAHLLESWLASRAS